MTPQQFCKRVQMQLLKVEKLQASTADEQAKTAKTKAETTQIYVNSGLIPDDIMARAVAGQLIEDGTYPGAEDDLATVQSGIAGPEENETEIDNPSEPAAIGQRRA
jgi:hypothetical protein